MNAVSRRLVASAFVASAVAALMPCGVVRAQWSSNPAVNLPLVTAANDQVQPKIRLTSNGGAYISWFDNRTGGYDVYLQRIDKDGNPQWAANGILIADRDFSSTQDYGLAVDANDHALLAYRTGTGTTIGVQKIAMDGSMPWGAAGVTLGAPAGGNSPRVTVTSSGDYVVGWSENNRIMLQKLNADGASQWGGGILVEDPDGRPILLADLQPSDSGNIIALWMRCAGTNCITSNKHLHAQKFNTSGAAMWNAGTPVIVFDGTSIQNATFPAFVSDAAGGAVFGWYEVGGNRNAYVQRITSSGAELFAHNGVASTGATPGIIRISAYVDFDPATQEIFLAWTDSNSLQTQWGVKAQRFSSAGARLWTDNGATILATNANQNSFVRLLAHGGGCIAHYFHDQPGGTAQVKSARLNAAGAAVWAGSPVTTSSRPTGKSRLDAVLDSCGMSLLAWADGASGGGQDIMLQNVRDDGTLGAPAPGLLGDLNCDQQVDMADVPPFVLVLLDDAAYDLLHPCCDKNRADMNSDTRLNGRDCAGFVDALIP